MVVCFRLAYVGFVGFVLGGDLWVLFLVLIFVLM